MPESTHVGKSRGVKYFRCLIVHARQKRRQFQEKRKKGLSHLDFLYLAECKFENTGSTWFCESASGKSGSNRLATEPYRIYSESRMHVFFQERTLKPSFFSFSFHDSFFFSFDFAKILRANLINIKWEEWRYSSSLSDKFRN